MSDTTASESRFDRFFVTRPDNFDLDNKYTEAALERHKREGLGTCGPRSLDRDGADCVCC